MLTSPIHIWSISVIVTRETDTDGLDVTGRAVAFFHLVSPPATVISWHNSIRALCLQWILLDTKVLPNNSRVYYHVEGTSRFLFRTRNMVIVMCGNIK